MSLVNAVHVLLEVAAGRRNLTASEADELHAAVDAEQDEAPGDVRTVQPDPTPDPGPAGSSAGPSTSEGVNLDAPADA